MVRCILACVAAFLVAGVARAASTGQAPPIEDYGKLPVISRVTLSPSGQRYAFNEVVGGKTRLVIASATNQVLQSYNLGTVKMEGLQWAGDEHLLVHTSVTANMVGFSADKSELPAVIVVSSTQNKAFAVFQGQTKVATTVVGSYGTAEIGGHWYGFFGAYTYNQRDRGLLKTDANGRLYPDLYKVDLDTGAFELAAPGQEDISGWLVGRDGKVAARLLYNQKTGVWRLYGSDWGAPELAEGSAQFHDVSIVGFGHTAGDLLLETSGTDHNVIQEVSLANGRVEASYNSEDIGSPLYDRVTGLWIGQSPQVDGVRASKFFAGQEDAKLRGAFKPFAKYIANLTSYSADFNRMIVRTEGGDDSGTYWIVDIGAHAFKFVGGAYPTIDAAHVGDVRWVDYKAADGLPVRGVLTLPPGRPAKSLPLVVMPHGGPEAHDVPGFDWWAQAFAVRGYAVWQPNFRGSSGAGNAFRDAGYGQWGRKMQTDISDGVAELARQGLIDPKRACIVGASYGGYAALAGVTVQHGLYRCAVSYGGVSDLNVMLKESGDFSASKRYWKQFMGAKSEWGDAALSEISPAHLAEHADAPILLINGVDDTVVPPDQSGEMERALRHAGKPVERIVLPGADHWLLEEPTRIAMVKASVDFVQKYNPPDPAPAAAPQKTTQAAAR